MFGHQRVLVDDDRPIILGGIDAVAGPGRMDRARFGGGNADELDLLEHALAMRLRPFAARLEHRRARRLVETAGEAAEDQRSIAGDRDVAGKTAYRDAAVERIEAGLNDPAALGRA